MKAISTLLIFLCICANLAAQNYAVGSRVINFIDVARSNRQIPANVYYPADVAGNNVPIAAGTANFPLVVFGHGFVIPVSAYKWLADSLVIKGYIVVLPTTESSLFPSHGEFGNDLVFLGNYILSQNEVAGSFFYQRLNLKAAVGGHSMGGGSSFLAAANSASSFSAIFNFAAAETNPSATNAAAAISQPTLLFSGSLDCIVPPGTQMQMYNNLTSSCKAYVNITGALHCQFADNNGTCALGQALSGCNSSPITAATVFNKTTALLIPFLDYQLKDNCLSGFEYLDALINTAGVVSTTNCNISPQCGVLPVSLATFTGNVLKSSVQLKWTIDNTDELSHFTLERSSDGIHFDPFLNVAGSTSFDYVAVDENPFPAESFYRLKILNKDGTQKLSRVINVTTSAQQLAMISIMPNPVKNNLQVKLAARAPQQVFATIYNVNGQVQLSSLIINQGINNKTVSIAKLPAGLYFISFKNSAGILISSARFIKE